MKWSNGLSVACILLIFLFFGACSPNNVTKEDSLKSFFDSSKVDGCFALYDNGTGQFTVYNLSRYKDSAYLPASTFKIVNSLIGIETGRIVNEKMIIKWDGIVRKHDNGDTNRIDTFWLDNSLKVTPDEQLGLVKKLYFNQLGFQKRTQEIVKKVMLREDNANYKLYYKTGLGYKEDGKSIGWIVGWIEENRHPYFFVLNLEGEHNADLVTARMNILTGILKKEGFFEGKR